jgi:hypothetical protein
LQIADANNFVEMKLEIVGYKDPGKKKKAMRLHLVDGLPSLMNVQHMAMSFESLNDLGDYLRQDVKVYYSFFSLPPHILKAIKNFNIRF